MSSRTGATAPSVSGARLDPRDLVAMTKPGIVVGNTLMTAVGLALAPAASWTVVLATLLGTAMLIACCGVFNMIVESDVDGLMARTSTRPMVDGRVSISVALAFGTLLVTLGSGLLFAFANTLAAGFGLTATIVYVGLYTPLKRYSWSAVPVGAVAGALPPVIGWVAAGGALDATLLSLFAVLFVWQLPHFMAIGIRRWADYDAAGLAIGTPPPLFDRAILSIRVLSVALLALTVLAALLAQAGWAFGILGFMAAAAMVAASARPVDEPIPWAKKVFLASLFYLPAFAVGAFLPF